MRDPAPDGPSAEQSGSMRATVDYDDTAQLEPERAAGLAAHRIGRYVMLRLLGQGSMGVVYAAYDDELDRKLALKLLHESALTSSDRRARITREAQAMARVSHPNVVQVYEVGEVRGRVFVAMEYIEGTTLAAWQRQQPRSWEEVLRIYIATGEGLLAAHRSGLVHRDFKPDNVLVGTDERPRVADFGLARAAGSILPQPSVKLPSSVGLLESPLTQDGALLGTPAYMSCEQLEGKPADSRSDQWSFCAALYEALYHQLPFSGADLAELTKNVRSGQLRSAPPEHKVPALIEQTLRRGLSADPNQRFPSMAELLLALDIDPQHDPAAAPQLGRVFSIAMLGTGFLLSAAIGLSLDHKPPSTRYLFGAALFLLLCSLITGWLLRHALTRNQFHRGLVKMVIIWTAQMAGLRGVGLLLGLSLAQESSMELVATAALLATASVHYLPALWSMTVGFVVAACFIPSYPGAAWAIVGVLYPALGLVFLFALNRVVRQVAPRKSAARLRQRQVPRSRPSPLPVELRDTELPASDPS